MTAAVSANSVVNFVGVSEVVYKIGSELIITELVRYGDIVPDSVPGNIQDDPRCFSLHCEDELYSIGTVFPPAIIDQDIFTERFVDYFIEL